MGKPAWESIGTAPKDGSYIWLANKSNRRVCWWCDVDCEWKDSFDLNEDRTCKGLDYFKPTHWQHLPELP